MASQVKKYLALKITEHPEVSLAHLSKFHLKLFVPVRDKGSVPRHTQALSALPQLPGPNLPPEDCVRLVHTIHTPFLASSCVLWSLLASGLQAGLCGDVLHLCILAVP